MNKDNSGSGVDYDSLTDELLIEFYYRGFDDAFSAIMRRYDHKNVSFYFSKTGSREDSKDLNQETWVRVTKSRDPKKQFDASMGAKFSTWLYRIRLNLFLDYQKRNNRERSRIELINLPAELDGTSFDDVLSRQGVHVASAHEELQATELARASCEYLLKLPPTDARVLQLWLNRDYNHYKQKDIAILVGMSDAAVSGIIHGLEKFMMEFIARKPTQSLSTEDRKAK